MTDGCSEGLDAFIFSLKQSESIEIDLDIMEEGDLMNYFDIIIGRSMPLLVKCRISYLCVTLPKLYKKS